MFRVCSTADPRARERQSPRNRIMSTGPVFECASILDSNTRCRANIAHVRQSRPDPGLGFQVKFLTTCKWFPLGSEADCLTGLVGVGAVLQKDIFLHHLSQHLIHLSAPPLTKSFCSTSHSFIFLLYLSQHLIPLVCFIVLLHLSHLSAQLLTTFIFLLHLSQHFIFLLHLSQHSSFCSTSHSI